MTCRLAPSWGLVLCCPQGRKSQPSGTEAIIYSLVSWFYFAECLSSSLMCPDGLPSTHTCLPVPDPGALAVLVPTGSHPVCVPQLHSHGRRWGSGWPSSRQCPPLARSTETRHRQGCPGHILQDGEAAGHWTSLFLFPELTGGSSWRPSLITQ